MFTGCNQERLLGESFRRICDTSGREKDCKKSAEIFFDLAILYKKKFKFNSDKIALVKCIGLLNAAICRNPSNTNMKLELSQVCQDVLQFANAKNESVDLIEKAKEIKSNFVNLREEITTSLNNVQPIPAPNFGNGECFQQDFLENEKVRKMSKIQKRITKAYIENMAALGKFCESVMGSPPCKYTIVGLGSLARKEITPYSDFEHIIIVEEFSHYENFLEYFRWFSVIFHTIILNMQETIVPALNISCLNDEESKNCWFIDEHTTRGVSFDGMMPNACKFPLGIQRDQGDNNPLDCELIKPVSKMLEYLKSEKDLNEGYYISNVLAKPCFVFGDTDTYNSFVEQIKPPTVKHLINLIKKDLEKFSTEYALKKLKSKEKLNIKQMVYRSATIFLSAAGLVHDIPAAPCADIINALCENGHITNSTKQKLHYAVAVACESRLKIYMERNSQHDYVPLGDNPNTNRAISTVGKWSMLQYFQIAYCVQYEISKILKIQKYCTNRSCHLLNLFFYHAFGFKEESAILANKLLNEEILFETNDSCPVHESFDNRLKFLQELNASIFKSTPPANINDQAEMLVERCVNAAVSNLRIS